MKRSGIFAIAAAALSAASLLVIEHAAAAPENVCRARCSRYDPAEFPKEERWRALRQYEQCLATCRRSGERRRPAWPAARRPEVIDVARECRAG
jgi:hypothetical protein